MPEEMKIGCAKPLAPPEDNTADSPSPQKSPEEVKPMITVGMEAPDFTAPAYHKGKFVEVKLSEFRGKWVALCFYPGDFTFV